MKVLGVAFSCRKSGNGMKILRYLMEGFNKKGYETEIINGYDYKITPCSGCDIECFKGKKCPVNDDVYMIYDKCFESDIVIFSIPDYSGHLSSLYFAFTERAQGKIDNYDKYIEKYLKKINFIVVGNLSAGGDMALHQALYDFSNRDFFPETLLFSSREYGLSSIAGNLIENDVVKRRLDDYLERVDRKYNSK